MIRYKPFIYIDRHDFSFKRRIPIPRKRNFDLVLILYYNLKCCCPQPTKISYHIGLESDIKRMIYIHLNLTIKFMNRAKDREREITYPLCHSSLVLPTQHPST